MYGLIISAGIVVALLVAEQKVSQLELNKDLFWSSSFWAILFGLIGARIYHVIDYWEIYSQNLVAIPMFWAGGMGILGGIILGSVAFVLIIKGKKENINLWLNTVVVGVPLAQAVGRWGNYFNNELLPYAIYESVLDLVLFGILTKTNKHVFFIYLIGYSTIRLILEPIHPGGWQVAGLNVAQTISILLIGISIWQILKLQKN